MTGPEHYREAERHLALAAECLEGTGHEQRHVEYAKVHATLALAAAQLDRNVARSTGASVPEFHDWAGSW